MERSTCMWEDGVCLGIKATTREVIVGNRSGVWLTRTVWRKTARERWDRSDLEMIVCHFGSSKIWLKVLRWRPI